AEWCLLVRGDASTAPLNGLHFPRRAPRNSSAQAKEFQTRFEFNRRTCAHKSAFCKRGSVNVRFAPKATKCCVAAKRRYVPKADERAAAKFLIRSPRGAK